MSLKEYSFSPHWWIFRHLGLPFDDSWFMTTETMPWMPFKISLQASAGCLVWIEHSTINKRKQPFAFLEALFSKIGTVEVAHIVSGGGAEVGEIFNLVSPFFGKVEHWVILIVKLSNHAFEFLLYCFLQCRKRHT